MTSSIKDDLLVGQAAAAAYLGLDEGLMGRLTRNGDVPSVKKGRLHFYRKSELERAFSTGASA